MRKKDRRGIKVVDAPARGWGKVGGVEANDLDCVRSQ